MKNTLFFFLCALFCIATMPVNGQSDYESPLYQKKKGKETNQQKKGKVGYKSFTEAGVLVPEFDFEQLTFSAFSSHGVYFNNAYLGLGVGFDRYDTLSLLPLVIDGRYIFTGKARSQLSGGAVEPKGFNLFVFFSGGYSKNLSENEDANSDSLILQCGMGMLIGKLEDVRMTITFGYKYQELPRKVIFTDVNQYDSFNIKLGIEFRT